MSFAHDGEGRESLAKGEPSASRDVGVEDIIHYACGCEGCIGQGDQEIHSIGAFGKKCRDDGILSGLWTIDEGGVDLGEDGLVCHIAEAQDALSKGRAVLVSKGLDSGIRVEVHGSLVGALQGVCEVGDSGREAGIGQARPSHPEACHLGSADDSKPGIELRGFCWVAGGDGGDLSGGGWSSSYEGRGHTVPLDKGSYDGCGITASGNSRHEEHDMELGLAVTS